MSLHGIATQKNIIFTATRTSDLTILPLFCMCLKLGLLHHEQSTD